MGTEVDDTQLRRFVVQVRTADGQVPLGTGVLVAPGWALTCAHVVEGLDEVRLVPDRGAGISGQGAAPLQVQAAVRARSADREPDARSAFWPFPDLAVLELHGWGDLQGELNLLSRQKRWAEMGALIDDDVLEAFAVVAAPDDVAARLLDRFGGTVDRLSLYTPYAAPPEVWEQVRTTLQAAG